MLVSVKMVVIVIGLFSGVLSAPRILSKIRFDPNYVKIVSEFKKLETRITKDDIRTIATIGLIQGTQEVQKSMEKQLTDQVADLILNLDMSSKSKTMPKINKIEKMMERDRQAIEILGNALDLARRAITADEFRMDMKKISQEMRKKQRHAKRKMEEEDMRERLEGLKRDILDHVHAMNRMVEDKTNATVEYLERAKRLASYVRTPRKTGNDTISIYRNATESILKSILTETIENNLIDVNRTRRQYDDASVEDFNIGNDTKLASQQEGSSEENGSGAEGGGGGGGIVGLIASLSGGEGGSDVGALLGAITGLVSNLFGPGGLDIPTLLSSGTSLLSGLLAGDKNFGTVLGEYVGTAVDGLSGGGGAINNGQFFGNFLGTVFAQLSADPEDDDEPPKPMIFVQNLLSSFFSAKNKAGDAEDDQRDAPTGSDSFGFITHVVRAIVGGVTSFVLNASLGSSGGSSQGSSALFSSSSQPKHPHSSDE